MKSKRRRVIITCTAVFGGAILLYLLLPRPKEITLSYSQLLDKLSHDQISQVTIDESDGLFGKLVSGEKFKTELTNQFVQAELVKAMKEKSVALSFQRTSSTNWSTILMAFLPILAVIVLWLLLLRQMRNIGNAKNKMVAPAGKSVTNREDLAAFRDVAGYQQIKQELQEIIDFLRSPLAFEQLGAEVPRNILLVGPPGTGKTMLTQAIAQSATVPFFHLAGSEAVELFVGVGAMRIRELFERAEQNDRAIIFIDEIDAIARKRATALMHSNMEHDQTLNQLLVLLDGFIKARHPKVIFFAATNREDVLDPAFLQRMNRRIVVNLPKQLERELIIRKHATGRPFHWDDAQIGDVAEQAAGFSGRELKNLINESARQSYHRLLRTAEDGCPASSGAWQFFRPQKGHPVKSPGLQREYVADWDSAIH
jgi:cell division protease FtsH